MRRSLILGLLSLTAAAFLPVMAACNGNDDKNGGDSGTGNDGVGDGGSALTAFTGDESVTGGSKVTANRTLTRDKAWLMKGIVYVPSGITLTIEKGTTIKGDKASSATLVIQPGGKLVAEGTADEPIVFTSAAADGQKQAGDWGGVVVLGRAPINGGRATDAGISPEAYVEGLNVTEENRYGGSNADDDSGVIRYVRIEYSGIRLGTDNEINGLTFGGVGRGTKVDHVMVRHTLDDCFEWFGGTVDAKYLVCSHNQDDAFDMDNGYSGRLQFLVAQQDPNFDDEMNGFEVDNDALGTDGVPVTNPKVYNATLCGQSGSGGAKRKFGALLRRNTAGTFRNLLVWGFDAALDVRDAKTHARAQETSQPSLSVRNSQWFNFTAPGLVDGLAIPETKDAEKAFGEAAWLATSGYDNVVSDPAFDCKNEVSPKFAPASVVVDKAAAPPSDGFFDPNAKYVGAFKDASDAWATTGNWVKWTTPGS